jgi:hypothetical protein
MTGVASAHPALISSPAISARRPLPGFSFLESLAHTKRNADEAFTQARADHLTPGFLQTSFRVLNSATPTGRKPYRSSSDALARQNRTAFRHESLAIGRITTIIARTCATNCTRRWHETAPPLRLCLLRCATDGVLSGRERGKPPRRASGLRERAIMRNAPPRRQERPWLPPGTHQPAHLTLGLARRPGRPGAAAWAWASSSAWALTSRPSRTRSPGLRFRPRPCEQTSKASKGRHGL